MKILSVIRFFIADLNTKFAIGLLLANVSAVSLHAQLSGPVTINVASPSMAMVTTTETANQNANSTELYTVGNSCDAILQLTPLSDLGLVTVKVSLGSLPGSINGQPFLGRHYEIHPSQNFNSSADVTLYFAQSDFDAYNNLPEVIDGTFPAILPDGSNLLITAFHGLPTDGTTGPNGEWDINEVEVYNPIVTQTSAGIFESTFTVNGFSGFFAHTNTAGTPLFLDIVDFTAISKGATNQINWTSINESSGDLFILERSDDASSFQKLRQVAASGHPSNMYQVIDQNPLAGMNYYRLKIINKDGAQRYSRVVFVRNDNDLTVVAYPHPLENELFVEIKGSVDPHSVLRITDVLGKVLVQLEVSSDGILELSTHNLSAGMYYLQLSSGEQTKTIKLTKK